MGTLDFGLSLQCAIAQLQYAGRQVILLTGGNIWDLGPWSMPAMCTPTLQYEGGQVLLVTGGMIGDHGPWSMPAVWYLHCSMRVGR